jgi:predicted transcriptional regulator
MKDAILTVRLPSATRKRLEALAKREGRSLSAQVERLLEQSLAPAGPGRRRTRPLAGALAGGLVPTLAEFREARAVLSASLLKDTRQR